MIGVDTNVLLRVVLDDDEEQAKIAKKILLSRREAVMSVTLGLGKPRPQVLKHNPHPITGKQKHLSHLAQDTKNFKKRLVPSPSL